jgi:hypothetical protein
MKFVLSLYGRAEIQCILAQNIQENRDLRESNRKIENVI